MALIEQPWARVKQPTVLPRGIDRDLMAGMPAEQLAELLRDHLVPSGAGGEERAVWDRFWAVLGGDEDLAERAFDVLEDFLDQAEDALDTAEPDHPQRKRMQKFQLNAQNAWQRLQKDPAATRTAPGAGRRLAAAIAAHRDAVERGGRAPTTADVELWGVLVDVGVDPSTPQSPR